MFQYESAAEADDLELGQVHLVPTSASVASSTLSALPPTPALPAVLSTAGAVPAEVPASASAPAPSPAVTAAAQAALLSESELAYWVQLGVDKVNLCTL